MDKFAYGSENVKHGIDRLESVESKGTVITSRVL